MRGARTIVGLARSCRRRRRLTPLLFICGNLAETGDPAEQRMENPQALDRNRIYDDRREHHGWCRNPPPFKAASQRVEVPKG